MYAYVGLLFALVERALVCSAWWSAACALHWPAPFWSFRRRTRGLRALHADTARWFGVLQRADIALLLEMLLELVANVLSGLVTVGRWQVSKSSPKMERQVRIDWLYKMFASIGVYNAFVCIQQARNAIFCLFSLLVSERWNSIDKISRNADQSK
jgi:hypothetical protein